jgi:hypothetical protein
MSDSSYYRRSEQWPKTNLLRFLNCFSHCSSDVSCTKNSSPLDLRVHRRSSSPNFHKAPREAVRLHTWQRTDVFSDSRAGDVRVKKLVYWFQSRSLNQMLVHHHSVIWMSGEKEGRNELTRVLKDSFRTTAAEE